MGAPVVTIDIPVVHVRTKQNYNGAVVSCKDWNVRIHNQLTRSYSIIRAVNGLA